MAMDQPIVRQQTWVRVVEPEIVIRYANSPVGGHRDGGYECLPVGGGNVRWRLVDSNRRRPGGPAIGGHSECDIVVKSSAEPRVFKDHVEVAVSRVNRRTEKNPKRVLVFVGETGIGIGGLKNWDPRAFYRPGPGLPSVGGANNPQNCLLLLSAAVCVGKPQVAEQTHKCAVGHCKDLRASSFVAVARVKNLAGWLPTQAPICRAGKLHEAPIAIAGLCPRSIDIAGVGRVGGNGRLAHRETRISVLVQAQRTVPVKTAVGRFAYQDVSEFPGACGAHVVQVAIGSKG